MLLAQSWQRCFILSHHTCVVVSPQVSVHVAQLCLPGLQLDIPLGKLRLLTDPVAHLHCHLVDLLLIPVANLYIVVQYNVSIKKVKISFYFHVLNKAFKDMVKKT